MPDYGFNLNLGPQSKQMTIADMLGIAQGAQQLQQAQQMNPLLLRQQQLNMQKMEALNPEEIQTGIVKQQEERKQAPMLTELKALELRQKHTSGIKKVAGAYATDSRILNAAKNPQDQKARENLGQALTELSTILESEGIDKQTANIYTKMIGAVAEKEPAKLPIVFKNLALQEAGAAQQVQQATPKVGNVGGAPALINEAEGTAKPLVIEQTETPRPPQKSEFIEPSGKLPYPVRRAGDIRPYAPGEAEDQKVQQQHRQVLLERQRNLTSAERIADEVIKTAGQLEKEAYFAKGGIAGNLERKMRMWIESETYDRLAKDLANQALANAKVLGTSDTVGGLNLAEAATGSVKVPPEVIIEIARRNKADQVNIDLQAKAKNEFAKKYGDSNGAAFDQMWRDNSDSLLFEAIAIDKSKMPADKKKEAFKKLFKDLSPENIAKIKQQKQNIDRMVNGEFPGIQ